MKHKLEISVEVLHADDDIIVVNKPSGVIVHRAPGYPDGTLCDILLKDFDDVRVAGKVIGKLKRR